MVDLEGFRALAGPAGQRLLALVAAGRHAGDLPDPVRDPLIAATRLRRRYPELPPPLVAAALTQVRLRAQAYRKFGPDAARMYFTPDGLEQATTADVAAYRASALGARGVPAGGRILDVCCGVGGDMIALARAGYAVHAIDRDPLTAEVARANAEALGLGDRVSVELAGAEDIRVGGRYDAVFCDPGRRTGGRRVFAPSSYSPPLPVALDLAARARHGCVKVAPGIPRELVPNGAEAEWISDRGEVKEAALWLGEAAQVRRRATVLPSGASLGAGRHAGEPPVGPPRRFLYEPDGAVLRAHLVGEVAALVGGTLLDATIAYVTADRLVPTPFASRYEVTDVLPFSLKRLRALLRARDVGAVTIKKRGSAVDVERLRRDLRLSGGSGAVLVLTRTAGSPTVLLCRDPPPGR